MRSGDHVRTAELAAIIEETELGYSALAEAVGITPRALYRIRKAEAKHTDFFLADRILTAMGRFATIELTVVTKEPPERKPLADDDPRHGTYNGYRNYLCRCSKCRKANRLYHRAYRKRRRERELHEGS